MPPIPPMPPPPPAAPPAHRSGRRRGRGSRRSRSAPPVRRGIGVAPATAPRVTPSGRSAAGDMPQRPDGRGSPGCDGAPDRGAGRRPAATRYVRAPAEPARRACRRRRPGPRRRRRSGRRARAWTAGGRCRIVVRSAVTRRSVAWIAASVIGSTALVASSSTSTPRVGEQRPGQRQPLPLAAGQGQPALADHRVVAVRQRLDELGRLGGRAPRPGSRRRWRPVGRRRCSPRSCRRTGTPPRTPPRPRCAGRPSPGRRTSTPPTATAPRCGS